MTQEDVTREELIDAALEAGADPLFVRYFREAPEDSKSYVALRNHVLKDHKDPADFPNSGFKTAIWNGEMERAISKADTENTNILREAFPNRFEDEDE